FPYTTLFRSDPGRDVEAGVRRPADVELERDVARVGVLLDDLPGADRLAGLGVDVARGELALVVVQHDLVRAVLVRVLPELVHVRGRRDGLLVRAVASRHAAGADVVLTQRDGVGDRLGPRRPVGAAVARRHLQAVPVEDRLVLLDGHRV